MQPLEKSLRNRLERTVTDARTIAETIAKVALDQLGVGDRINDHHLSLAEKHGAKENSNYSYSGVGK